MFRRILQRIRPRREPPGHDRPTHPRRQCDSDLAVFLTECVPEGKPTVPSSEGAEGASATDRGSPGSE